MGYIDNLLRGRKVEWKTLGEVAEVRRGERVTKRELNTNSCVKFPVFSGGVTPMGFYTKHNQAANTITVVKYGTAGFVNFITEEFWANDVCYCIKPLTQVNNKYLFYILKNKQELIYSLTTEAIPKHLPSFALIQIPIPLPPLDVQVEIARILDRFTALEAELEAELEARQKQYEYYRGRLLTFDKTRTDVEWKTLGEVAEYEQPSKYLVHSTKYNDSFPTPVLTAGKSFILGYTDESSGIYRASEAPIILFDDFTTASRWVDFNFKVKSSATKIITSRDEGVVLLKYIYYWLNTLPSECVEGDHKRRWISTFTIKKIPLPPLAEQERIVRILDKFTALTTSLTAGLPREIALRRRQYEYYREQLLSFE